MLTEASNSSQAPNLLLETMRTIEASRSTRGIKRWGNLAAIQRSNNFTMKFQHLPFTTQRAGHILKKKTPFDIIAGHRDPQKEYSKANGFTENTIT